MKKIFYLFLVFNLFIISACDSSGGSSGGGIIPNNNTITIHGENIVYTGSEPVQYKAILNPANFTTESVIWSSDNNAVGTIDSATGLFTATAQGNVNITASAGGVNSAPFNVQVITIDVESVNVSSKSPKEINVGQSAEYTFEVTPEGVKYESIVWNVDNTAIANINKDTGVLIGNAPGTVNVTVTVNGVTSEPYPVNVVLPAGSIIINGPDTIYISSQNNYTVTTSPDIADNTIEWSIDNTNLATIDANGLLTTNDITGQVTITATAGEKTATKLVNIVKQLEISGNNTTAIGGVITLKVINNLSDNLIWNSDNINVATVENGVITGTGAGTANITVSENGNTSNPFTVTIKDVPNGYEIDENGAYHVYSIDGFEAWRTAVNEGYGVGSILESNIGCYLHSDLDFNNVLYVRVFNTYTGIFNGNDHIIKNYVINSNRGLFNEIGSGGQVSNVTFDNASIDFTFMFGINLGTGIVTEYVNNGSIENVHIKNSNIKVSTWNNYFEVGMVAGLTSKAQIKNCSVSNSTITLDGGMSATGGIIGLSYGNTTISGAFVDNLTISTQGTLNQDNGTSGIVGTSQKNDTIVGCGVANSKITSTGTTGDVGGIAGVGNGELHASFFYGTVSNENSIEPALDFSKFGGTVSSLYVKSKESTVGKVNGADTKIVDNTTVTWTDAVNSMNQYLTNNNYTDFSFRYDESKDYPVIDYTK